MSEELSEEVNDHVDAVDTEFEKRFTESEIEVGAMVSHIILLFESRNHLSSDHDDQCDDDGRNSVLGEMPNERALLFLAGSRELFHIGSNLFFLGIRRGDLGVNLGVIHVHFLSVRISAIVVMLFFLSGRVGQDASGPTLGIVREVRDRGLFRASSGFKPLLASFRANQGRGFSANATRGFGRVGLGVVATRFESVVKVHANSPFILLGRWVIERLCKHNDPW